MRWWYCESVRGVVRYGGFDLPWRGLMRTWEWILVLVVTLRDGCVTPAWHHEVWLSNSGGDDQS